MHNTAIATIDLSAIRDNLAVVRRLCPRSRIMAMIKANAYGHGLLPVAAALAAADGLAVARLQEALALRHAGHQQRILLLATLLDAADLDTCARLNIDVVAHDDASVECIAARAWHAPLKVWLKLDSGMHRAGLSAEAFSNADQILSRHPGVLELVHMTHFSSASDPASDATARQLACFSRHHSINPRAPASLANSAALISRPDTHADWVRPGIMLYGDNPVGTPQTLGLRPAITLSAHVLAVRDVGVGEGVGYDERWTAARSSRIATVGIGYGDGYPRHARNGTPVWINGELAPLVGRVSMDSLTVDVTDCAKVVPGTRAVLWGAELPAAVVAQWADTISYELFTCLQARVTQKYVGALA